MIASSLPRETSPRKVPKTPDSYFKRAPPTRHTLFVANSDDETRSRHGSVCSRPSSRSRVSETRRQTDVRPRPEALPSGVTARRRPETRRMRTEIQNQAKTRPRAEGRLPRGRAQLRSGSGLRASEFVSTQVGPRQAPQGRDVNRARAEECGSE